MIKAIPLALLLFAACADPAEPDITCDDVNESGAAVDDPAECGIIGSGYVVSGGSYQEVGITWFADVRRYENEFGVIGRHEDDDRNACYWLVCDQTR